MGLGQAPITQIGMNDCSQPANATQAAAYCRRSPELDWQSLSFFAVTVGLTVYGYYLAWESWKQVVRVVASPAPREVAVVSTAIQIVAPLLPPLSLLVIHLSWRRDGPWFFRTGALCLLGLVTAAAEVFGHGLR